jgi:hypothetical protein
MSSLMALCLSGRFKVITATPRSTVVNTRSLIEAAYRSIGELIAEQKSGPVKALRSAS